MEIKKSNTQKQCHIKSFVEFSWQIDFLVFWSDATKSDQERKVEKEKRIRKMEKEKRKKWKKRFFRYIKSHLTEIFRPDFFHSMEHANLDRES